jgi:CCR4-NOT transcriptional regulation complex NOT5 subunit
MAAQWEERLNQLERNFLAEVERLKDDILGQLQVDDEKYYTNIDNEVNTSFTSPSPSSAYASPSTSPSGSFRGVVKNGREGQHEVTNGASADGAAGGAHATPEAKTVISTSSFSSTVVPASLRQSQLALSPGTLSSSSSSSTPPPALPPQSLVEGDHVAGASKSRRVAPARQAEALVVRVRAAYKFESQEEDELPLPKGLELIAFMREVLPHSIMQSLESPF